MENEKTKTFVDKIWDLFASVTLAVVIFSLISLTSVVGTILEQGGDPARNIKLLSKMFGQSAAPGLYSFLERLGFMDMYHAWWFVALLLLFAANLVICSIDRLPRVMKLVKEKVQALPPEHIEKMSIKRSFSRKGNASQMKELAGGLLPQQSRSETSGILRRKRSAAVCREGKLYETRCIYYTFQHPGDPCRGDHRDIFRI